jgi:hypothetical protein
MFHSSLWRYLVIVGSFLLLMTMSLPLTMLPRTAFADTINPGVLDIGATLGGLTYGQWSEKWWQRAFSLPDNFTDCTENQPTGPVWFLDGTTGGSATRSCTVPAGKNIMFPLFNAEQSVLEGNSKTSGNLPGSSCPLRDINGKLIKGTDYDALHRCAQAIAQHALDPNATLEADIDGTMLQQPTHYRAATPSPLFPFTAVPGDPFAGVICAALNKCPLTSSVTSSAAADGFWIILDPPLKPGKHTIHFKADIPFIGFTTEVTYNLLVK